LSSNSTVSRDPRSSLPDRPFRPPLQSRQCMFTGTNFGLKADHHQRLLVDFYSCAHERTICPCNQEGLQAHVFSGCSWKPLQLRYIARQNLLLEACPATRNLLSFLKVVSGIFNQDRRHVAGRLDRHALCWLLSGLLLVRRQHGSMVTS
jgi:hypothetical protein